MKYKHYIFVNLLRYWKDRGLQKQSYLEYRLPLFEKYFVKGLNNQTCKNFEVILLSSEIYKDLDFSKFEELSGGKVIFLPDGQGVSTNMNLIVDDDSCDYILTTRTDSDDIWPYYFVEEIQKSFLSIKKECLIDFEGILKTNEDFSDYGYIKYGGSSMFLTTAFESENFPSKNCFAEQHTYMSSLFRNRQIIQKLGGACICHGKNLVNRVAGKKIKFDIENIYKLN